MVSYIWTYFFALLFDWLTVLLDLQIKEICEVTTMKTQLIPSVFPLVKVMDISQGSLNADKQYFKKIPNVWCFYEVT